MTLKVIPTKIKRTLIGKVFDKIYWLVACSLCLLEASGKIKKMLYDSFIKMYYYIAFIRTLVFLIIIRIDYIFL